MTTNGPAGPGFRTGKRLQSLRPVHWYIELGAIPLSVMIAIYFWLTCVLAAVGARVIGSAPLVTGPTKILSAWVCWFCMCC
jgi:hypothetical protein